MMNKAVSSSFEYRPTWPIAGMQNSVFVPKTSVNLLAPEHKPSVFTGTGTPILKESPLYYDYPEQPEPLASPQADLLETCLMQETARLSQQPLHRLVFDGQGESRSTGTQLRFESRFESGNLQRVTQVYEFEYDLVLSPDRNARDYAQWFYFTVGNTRANTPYKFNIVNFIKPNSLYNAGMKPCLYSFKRAKAEHRGWFRDGREICYYQSNVKRRSGGYFYTLSFTVSFPYDYDIVSIAHCYPYTYSDLRHDLDRLVSDPKRRNRVKRQTLSHTMAGNACELLTITNFACEPGMLRYRKGIAVMARVHPGESNASWMMKGLLDFLTGPSLDAKVLRDHFVFKIVPMLNPDGVINGATRCGLAGVDLNRCWLEPSERLQPTIHYSKQMLREFVTEREVVLCCDFHGHSRKKNAFMFGCGTRNSLREKVFPMLMERNCPLFSFAESVFGLQKAKEATARVVCYRELGITNSYTLESSFCGASTGPHANLHFTREDLKQIGHAFGQTILDFCDPDQTKINAVMQILGGMTLEPIILWPVEPKKRPSSRKKSYTKKKGPEKRKSAKKT